MRNKHRLHRQRLLGIHEFLSDNRVDVSIERFMNAFRQYLLSLLLLHFHSFLLPLVLNAFETQIDLLQNDSHVFEIIFLEESLALEKFIIDNSVNCAHSISGHVVSVCGGMLARC